MKTWICTLIIGLALPTRAAAQRYTHHALGVDVWTLAAGKGINLQYSYRLSAKTALVLNAAYFQHEPPPADLFEGDWSSEYVLEEIDTFYFNPNIPDPPTHQYLYGSGRPLPPIADGTTHLFTGRILLGYRMTSRVSTHGWQFFAQPGMQIALHRAIQSTQTTETAPYKTDIWNYLTVDEPYELTRSLTHCTDFRRTSIEQYWIGGVQYALGAAWHSRFGLSVEAGISGGLNFGERDWNAAPAFLHNYFVLPTLVVGYQWGCYH